MPIMMAVGDTTEVKWAKDKSFIWDVEPNIYASAAASSSVAASSSMAKDSKNLEGAASSSNSSTDELDKFAVASKFLEADVDPLKLFEIEEMSSETEVTKDA